MTQKTFLIEICCKMFAPLKRMHCVGLENRQYCYINRVSKTLVSDIHTRQVTYIQGKAMTKSG